MQALPRIGAQGGRRARVGDPSPHFRPDRQPLLQRTTSGDSVNRCLSGWWQPRADALDNVSFAACGDVSYSGSARWVETGLGSMNVAVRPTLRSIVSMRGVTKEYGSHSSAKVVLNNVDFDIPHLRSVALMGPNGAGKSTLLKLIAGTELPTRGEIRRKGKISWPLGFNGGYDKNMSGRENVVFVSRLYGLDPRETCDWVMDFSELGRYFDMPMQTYSSGMKQKLAFGLCMAVNFDCYLVDEVTAVGDDRFREKCQRAFADRRAESGMIMVSHSFATIRAYCDCAAVLVEGNLFYFDSLEEGIAEFKCLLRSLENA
jgi:capsular polysaccharide transport system ATP-binding protein